MRALVASLLLFLAPAAAHGWDGGASWYGSASGMSPGGGGMFGTGSARDYGITCGHCHIDRPGTIGVTITFTPPLLGGAAYEAGRAYDVEVTLDGELVGTSGCGQYLSHFNGFAATFEDAGGAVAGTLASDSGQTQTACPADYPRPLSGTTALYRDCQVIFGQTENEDEGRTSWRFTWTAPPPGAGPITLHYGVVDGDCTMMSMGDAVKVDQLTLPPGDTILGRNQSRSRRNSGYVLFLLLPLAATIAGGGLWWTHERALLRPSRRR